MAPTPKKSRPIPWHGSLARRPDHQDPCGRGRNGLPITLKLTEGQAHDGKSAEDMLDTVGAKQTLLADRAYDSDALRQTLIERGAWPNVKPKSNRKRRPVSCAFLNKECNLVERFFDKLKPFRGVATCYDKLAENYLGGGKLASTRIQMRHTSR